MVYQNCVQHKLAVLTLINKSLVFSNSLFSSLVHRDLQTGPVFAPSGELRGSKNVDQLWVPDDWVGWEALFWLILCSSQGLLTGPYMDKHVRGKIF